MLLIVLIRLALAAVFITAAAAKLIGRDAFASSLSALLPMRGTTASVTALAVPAAELVVGSELLTNGWMPWPAAAAAGMLIVFTAVIIVALIRRQKPVCGCFGPASRDKPITWRLVARNACLLSGCLLVVIANPPTDFAFAGWIGLVVALALVVLLRVVKLDRLPARAASIR